jgi:hypothetical protein
MCEVPTLALNNVFHTPADTLLATWPPVGEALFPNSTGSLGTGVLVAVHNPHTLHSCKQVQLLIVDKENKKILSLLCRINGENVHLI